MIIFLRPHHYQQPSLGERGEDLTFKSSTRNLRLNNERAGHSLVYPSVTLGIMGPAL